MSAAAISCCVLISIFIMHVGGHYIVVCADFKNLKLKLKLGMLTGRAMAAVAGNVQLQRRLQPLRGLQPPLRRLRARANGKANLRSTRAQMKMLRQIRREQRKPTSKPVK
jgi:hypothetical protein